MPEELIQPADDKDGDTVIGKRVQGIADRKKVLAHTDLPMVLPAAPNNEVSARRPCIPNVIHVDPRFIPIQPCTLFDHLEVAEIPVNIHVFGIEAYDIKLFPAGTHNPTSSTLVICDSTLRAASMAV